MHNEVLSCGRCGVKIENLTVVSEGKKILDDINLDIHCGEFVALIGRNGAGKTTLLKAILGEINYQGKISYVDHCGCGLTHAHVGYVPQSFNFEKSSPVSVGDFLNAFNNNRPVYKNSREKSESVKKSLEKAEIAHLENRRLGELSGGELQRVMLAFALNPVPDLLILDEPISGVDQRGMDIFYNLVGELRKEHHIAVVLVSHDFALVEKYATKAILIDKKVMAEDVPEKVFKSKEFYNAFGYPMGGN